MQLGMVGLGRMGGNIVRRLQRKGHACAVFDVNPKAAAAQDDVRRARALAARDLHHVDVGTSGGVCRVERGYCVMAGDHAERPASGE